MPFTFGGYLARQRISLKRTQADIADALTAAGYQTRAQSVSAWERDAYRPQNLAIVTELERILDCPGELMAALGGSSGPGRIDDIERRLQDLEDQQRATQQLLEAATRTIQELTAEIRRE